ncbi:MAG: IS66 family transposase, partial [Solirubrobacteraceae bacterium]
HLYLLDDTHRHPPSSPNKSTRTSGQQAGYLHNPTNLKDVPLVCLAHLARNFQAYAERAGPAGRHGARIKSLLGQIMVLDRITRADGRALHWWKGELQPLHDQLMDALEAGERSHTQELATLCGAILDLWPALWNFTEHPNVDATNNRAERAIRHAVLWRKTSGGTQPKTANDSSNGSSRSARPTASKTVAYTPT